MQPQIFRINSFQKWQEMASLALMALALMLLTGQAYAQQIPNIRFSTDGITGIVGDATSTNGVLRGDIKFGFRGHITNGKMWIYDAYVRLPQEPGGSTPKFWRVRATGYGDTINQQGKAQVEFRTSDPTYNILTITKLPAVEDFSRTNGKWNGVMKVTLRFSKINGVADTFSVEFTPVNSQSNPPAAARGTISSARPKVGSDLILQR